MHRIISTGSHGNAVLYSDNILVDIGVPFSALKDHINDIQIVLLTHSHNDHLNINTLKKLAGLRPLLRIGCCEWMAEYLSEFKNVDVYNIGGLYDYGLFKISPVALYHDVKNCGYRIFSNDKKIFHATDTAHLEGITAKNYDLYAIEHNYNEETVFDQIKELESQGKFAHQKGAINTHLSEQQANQFFFENKKDDSILIRLHESSMKI